MTSNATSIIVQDFQNNAPYFDNGEYEIEQGYVQELFQPSRALQARELTTLQSLLQFQLSQAGNFLFENGSPVQGGHITYDNSVKSIQIQANDAITLSQFSGTLIVNQVGAVNTQAVVITTDSSLTSNTVEGALLIKYLSGNEFPDGGQIQIATGLEQTALLIPSNATSQASIASINEGVFYVDGYFVFVEQQSIVLNSLSAFPTCRVGLQINKNIISSAQDSSLLDPAQGSFNFQAPGADRFQIQLTLATRSLQSTDDSLFIELLRIENGVIISQIDYPILGNISDELAQRTYDTNGNFVVNPFLATALDDPSNSNNVILTISAGKGFVDGYEFQTISPTHMSLPKALTTNSSIDYQLSLAQGELVTVTNLFSGNNFGFNTGNFGNLDLHIVTSGNVNTFNSQAYANTHVGTARVRDIEWAGANLWNAYLLDVNVAPITVNAASVAANTTSFVLPPTFPTVTNAFSNVVMTVLAGNSSGDVRTIVSYQASTKTAFLNRPTTQLLDTTSQISLQFGIKDVNGLVGAPTNTAFGNVFATQNSTAGFYPCMDISVNGGKDQQGNTVLFDQQFNRLDFPLPQSFIAQNTFSDVTFMNRKTLATVQFTSGNATIGTGSGLDPNEVYTFGLVNQYLSNLLASENFFLVVRNAQTGNIANGQVITWDINGNPGGNGVFQTDSTHVTLKTVTTGNFIADVILTVEDQNASVNFRRQKTYTGNTSNTTLRSTDSYLNGTAVIGTANANTIWIDTANAIVWMNSWPDIQKVPGVRMSIGLPDVIQIIKIYDSGNPNFMPNTTNAIDITSRYNFDSGQRDNYYDHAGLILNPGNSPPTGQVAIMLVFYAHSLTSGFFSADSYSASNYANNQIPIYSSANYPAVSLRDVIDFRPTRTPGYSSNIQQFSLTGLRLPQPDDAMTISFNYYLPRIDKLVLTKQRQFSLVSGTPALAPPVPADQSGAMTLYVINIPQYTYVAANVSFNYVENKRYTMSDIGNLDKRITALEYEVGLNALEQSAMGQTVLYQGSTAAKEQYGLITDAFVDFSVVDVNNPDMACHISQGTCGVYVDVTPITFMFTSNTGPAETNEQTYSLAFSETPIIVQNTASDQEQVQPYAFGSFKGQVRLFPSTDYFYSDDIIPQIVGPVFDVPIITPVVPTVPVTTTGTGTDKNPAKLTPPVTNKTPTTPAPPASGFSVPAASHPIRHCFLSNDDFWFNGYRTLNYAYRVGFPDGIGGVNYYGSACYDVQRRPSGFGYIYPYGGWYVTPTQTVAAAAKAATQSASTNVIRGAGGGFGI